MKVLLRAKADPLLEAGDGKGRTCGVMEIAAELGHSAVVWEIIQQVGVPPRGGGLGALEGAANPEITGMLTDAGVTDTACEALINAARRGDLQSLGSCCSSRTAARSKGVLT